MTVTVPPGTAAGPVDGEIVSKTDHPEAGRDEDPGHHLDLELGRRLRQLRHVACVRFDVRALVGAMRSVVLVHDHGEESTAMTRSTTARGRASCCSCWCWLCGMLDQPAGCGSSGRVRPAAPTAAAKRRRLRRPRSDRGRNPITSSNALGNPAAILVDHGPARRVPGTMRVLRGPRRGLDPALRPDRPNPQTKLADRADRSGKPDQRPRRRARRIRAGEDQVRPRHQGTEAARLRRAGPECRRPQGRRRRGAGPLRQRPGRKRPRSSSPTSSRTRSFSRIFQPSLVVAAGPVKLGITAVIDPESLQKLNDPDKDALLPVDQESRCRLAGRAGRARSQERLSGADGSGTARAGPEPGQSQSRL